MDGSSFDTLARLVAVSRRSAFTSVVLAATAALGAASFPAAEPAVAKRKRKKRKRCIKLLRACHVGGRKCCHRHVCQSFDTGANGTFFCCKSPGQPCTSSQQCCPPSACFIETGSTVGTCEIL